MTTELFIGLERASVSITIALVLVLICRTAIRHQFGTVNAYGTWLVVPLLPLASLVTLMFPTAVITSENLKWFKFEAAATQFPVPVTSSIDVSTAVVAFWLLGIVISLLLQSWRQALFMRSLGGIEKFGDVYRSQSVEIGPALVGFLRPKIIVPFDFVTRYSQAEQALILAHEQIHLKRGDNYANALCTVVQCIFWFHPLIHCSVSRFRFDQELACDALVMTQHQNLRKTYASAMLKTHAIDISLPVGCTWQSSHSLKERIMTLNKKAPGTFNRYLGSGLIASVIAFTMCAAWATQSQPDTSKDKAIYDISMKLAIDGAAPSEPHLLVAAGEPFVVEVGSATNRWKGTFMLTAQAENSVKISMKLVHAETSDKLVGSPVILIHAGEWGQVKADDGKSNYELSIMAQRKSTVTAK